MVATPRGGASADRSGPPAVDELKGTDPSVDGEPSETPWDADVVLSDGGTVHVRPVHPSDLERWRAFHSALSSESVYYRYFSPKPRLSQAELTRFTTVDMVDRAALVAMLGDLIIADARYDRWAGKDEAEVAFVVADEHHGRGLSTLLLEHLASIARLNGIVRFTAEVLADNRAMLTVFAKAGWPLSRELDSGIIDVVFDIVPTPDYLNTVDRREQRAESRSMARLLHPRSVAVVGASDRSGSVGRVLLHNLMGSGFPGPVYAVNPAHQQVANMTCYPDLRAIPDDVALGLVAVPPEQLESVLDDAIAKNVRGLIIVTSDLPGPDDRGVPFTRRLVARARGNGMRIIGPASMGVLTTGGDAPLRAVLAPTAVRQGGVSISLQSGPLGVGLLELAARLGIGLSTFVSLGDRADVSGNDLLQYWEDDPNTKVVLLYTETFGNPRKFARIARRLTRTKPVVAVRAGGSADPTTAALYEQAGVIRVRTVRALFDTARVLDGPPLPRGDRVVVVSNATSPALLALDAARVEGLRPAEIGVDTAREVLDALPVGASLAGGVLQLTHRAMPADYAHAVEQLDASADVDALVVIFAPPMPDLVALPIDALVEVERGLAKPVVAVMVGMDDGPLAPGSRIPVFAFPEPAVGALGRIARWVRRQAEVPAGELHRPEGLDVDAARAVIERALTARPTGTLLPLSEAEALLKAYGVSVSAGRAVTSEEQAAAAAVELGFPVALKAAGMVRRGRSERAGVALDLHDASEVHRAWQGMADELGPAALVEVVVQAMAPPGTELRVAVEPHPALGPVLTFGLGGVLADAIGDRVPRLVPFAPGEAAAALAASRASRAIGTDERAVSGVIDLLERVACLVDDHPELHTLVINPALASTDGCWVVDVSAHVRTAPVHVDPVRRLV